MFHCFWVKFNLFQFLWKERKIKNFTSSTWTTETWFSLGIKLPISNWTVTIASSLRIINNSFKCLSVKCKYNVPQIVNEKYENHFNLWHPPFGTGTHNFNVIILRFTFNVVWNFLRRCSDPNDTMSRKSEKLWAWRVRDNIMAYYTSAILQCNTSLFVILFDINQRISSDWKRFSDKWFCYFNVSVKHCYIEQYPVNVVLLTRMTSFTTNRSVVKLRTREINQSELVPHLFV